MDYAKKELDMDTNNPYYGRVHRDDYRLVTDSMYSLFRSFNLLLTIVLTEFVCLAKVACVVSMLSKKRHFLKALLAKQGGVFSCWNQTR